MKVQVLLLFITFSFASKTLITVENHNGGVYVTFGEPLDDQSKFFSEKSETPEAKTEITMTYSSTFKAGQRICLNKNTSRKINGGDEDINLTEKTFEVIAFDPIEDFEGEAFCFSVTALFNEEKNEGTIFIKQATLDKEKNYISVSVNYDQSAYLEVKMKAIYFNALEREALGEKKQVEKKKFVSIRHIDEEDIDDDLDKLEEKDELVITFPATIIVPLSNINNDEVSNNINSKNQNLNDID